jgi:hypothetical protein
VKQYSILNTETWEKELREAISSKVERLVELLTSINISDGIGVAALTTYTIGFIHALRMVEAHGMDKAFSESIRNLFKAVGYKPAPKPEELDKLFERETK